MAAMPDASPPASSLERWQDAGFATRAIHAGQDPEPRTGAVAVPVFQTSTFAQPAVGEHLGWDYARSGNPTRDALEESLASLEGGRFGFAFASGSAAQDAVIRSLAPGDHVLIAPDVYGGTYRQFSRVHQPWGLDFDPVDLSSMDAVAAAWRPTTRMIWVETPTNPMLNVFDITALAELAHERDAKVVVDNTFATPYLQQPLALGADAVVHSTTKYLGGHSDVVGGGMVTRDEALADRVRFLQNSLGAVPGPWDVYLVLRGIKTLALRMDRHCDNAQACVEVLRGHTAVTEVLYPGLASHAGHEIATRQMRDYGGMISFRVGDEGTARRICGSFEVFTLGESLGAVESLVEHPGAMTHTSVAGSPLEVPADLIRLSVGVEDAEDLVTDLRQALARGAA
ncbi:cystathionine gamma-synthase [soil metagenome]